MTRGGGRRLILSGPWFRTLLCPRLTSRARGSNGRLGLATLGFRVSISSLPRYKITQAKKDRGRGIRKRKQGEEEGRGRRKEERRSRKRTRVTTLAPVSTSHPRRLPSHPPLYTCPWGARPRAPTRPLCPRIVLSGNLRHPPDPTSPSVSPSITPPAWVSDGASLRRFLRSRWARYESGSTPV